MKIGINGATTMRADLETDIKAAARAGYDYIEIWAGKMREYLKNHSAADLKKLIADNNLEPWAINSIEHISFRSDADFARIKAECEEFSRIAQEIGCPHIVVVPGKLPSREVSEDEIIEENVRVLNELADIAEKYHVKLAFEFLGQTDNSVQTLDLARKIIDQVNRDSVGHVIDTFHFYAGNSSIEAIETMKPEKLFIFHINGAEDLPAHELTDAHRLYPDEGILPTSEIKRAFDKIGYHKMVSIEIFRPEYWEKDPFEVAQKAKDATVKVLGLK